MNYIYKLAAFAVLLFGALLHINAQQIYNAYESLQPLHEVRAVWLTTIGGLDWPRIKANDAASAARQKEELCHILDSYFRHEFVPPFSILQE